MQAKAQKGPTGLDEVGELYVVLTTPCKAKRESMHRLMIRYDCDYYMIDHGFEHHHVKVEKVGHHSNDALD